MDERQFASGAFYFGYVRTHAIIEEVYGLLSPSNPSIKMVFPS